MADQGLWFKLWCSASDDPDLDNLDLADFARFCKLGLLVKSHGTDGTLAIAAPAPTLCAKMRVSSFAELVQTLGKLPHVELVSSETSARVTFRNWRRYQDNLSTTRVQKHRAVKQSRREEKRREENNPPVPPLTLDDAVRKYQPLEAYRTLDVRQAALNCQNWCVTRKKAFTDRRLVNWLNGEAMKAASSIGSRTKSPSDPYARYPRA